jgi:hypothetical protein
MKKEPSLAEQVHYRRKVWAKKSSRESVRIALSSIIVVLALFFLLGMFTKTMHSFFEKEEKIVIRGVDGVVKSPVKEEKGPPPSPESVVEAYRNQVAEEKAGEIGEPTVVLAPVLEQEALSEKASIIRPIEVAPIEVPGLRRETSSNEVEQ